MTNDEVRTILSDMLDEDTLDEMVLFENPDYADALIGYSESGSAVYDFDKMVDSLVKDDDMEPIEAIEFIEYNTVRAIPYANSMGNPPIIIHKIESKY